MCSRFNEGLKVSSLLQTALYCRGGSQGTTDTHWFKCYTWGFLSIDDTQKGVNNYALERDEGPDQNTNKEVSKQSWEEGAFYLGLQESI